jgi:hypothetical protein
MMIFDWPPLARLASQNRAKRFDNLQASPQPEHDYAVEIEKRQPLPFWPEVIEIAALRFALRFRPGIIWPLLLPIVIASLEHCSTPGITVVTMLDVLLRRT